ncbi:MAG: OadG family protein [Bacteroidales bacterium]|nr:OadG family protein [Bacteroidales bacterium]
MKHFTVLLIIIAACFTAKAQTPADLRINEVAVVRDSSGVVTDAWIEIYNSSTSRIDMQRLFLSDDRSNLRKCHIPANHNETQFPSRGFVVMDGDGRRDQGALHTSFDLSKSQWIYLVESNGYIIIDSAAVPQSGIAARATDGNGEWQIVDAATKGFSNAPDDGIANAEKFIQVDPYGGGVAIISMSVVFSVLIVLSLTFSLVGRFFKRKEEKATAAVTTTSTATTTNTSTDNTDDEMAAVAVAVTLYLNDAHDDANHRLTIIRTTSDAWKNAVL